MLLTEVLTVVLLLIVSLAWDPWVVNTIIYIVGLLDKICIKWPEYHLCSMWLSIMLCVYIYGLEEYLKIF